VTDSARSEGEEFWGDYCLFCGELIPEQDFARSYDVWIYGSNGGVGQKAHPACLERVAHDARRFREFFGGSD